MNRCRSKFKGDKTLDGYQKKKYVCKLLFIFLLGHDIDFGHMEAVNLLSSNKYTEKQIVSQPLMTSRIKSFLTYSQDLNNGPANSKTIQLTDILVSAFQMVCNSDTRYII